MTKYDEAFLFLVPESTAVERTTLVHAAGRTGLVWAPDPASAAEAAAELVADGARLIELYRGFDLATAAPVIDAVAGRAPVGVAFGGPPARHTVTIFESEQADPAQVRVVHEHEGGGTTTVIGAPDADIVAVAQEAVDAGAEVIQVCGGAPLTTAARVVAAIGDRATVTLTSWPFESIEGAVAYKRAFEANA
ncbi:DUF6506 family protein [Microlunatus sp. GCM10028923]|uniref:DUF6506 family protein n=1 Tax=Microlunatus sp. GCM10028923 TaxID=3273400 RepID=UPI0036194D4C